MQRVHCPHPPCSFGARVASADHSLSLGRARLAGLLLVGALAAVQAKAQFVAELDALNAPLGGSTADRFGTAVVWDSDFIAVGAPSWNLVVLPAGLQQAAGAVHIYTPTPSGVYNYLGTATEPEPKANNFYGQALSADDGWFAVGAPGTNLPGVSGGNQLQAGAAWIWRYSGDTWLSFGRVTHEDPRSIDVFGSALSMWHDRDSGRPPELAVGAPLDNAPSTNCGSLTIFALSSVTGQFEKSAFIGSPILPGASSFSAADGLFGSSVIHDGDLLIVGAKRRTDTVDKQGLVYVFRRNNGDFPEPIMPSPAAWGPWKLMQVLRTAADPLVSEEFGTSLDLYGNLLVVGAPGGSTSPGSVTVFSQVNELGSSFIPTGRMEAVGGRLGDLFGAAVQVTSGRCYIGAPGFDPVGGATLQNRGVVYEFEWSVRDGMWQQTSECHPNPPEQSIDPSVSMNVAEAGFGSCIALGAGDIVVGAPKASNALPAQGLVMVYDVEISPCVGDADGDGAVSASDLTQLLSAWGSNDPLADLNGDGIVSGQDMVLLMANFGPCGL